MTAAELLVMARSEGVALALAGDRLTWTADHQPRPELLAELVAHKVEIIAALAAANDAQPASVPPQAPTLAPNPAPAVESVPEAASEPRRNAWTVTRGGKPVGPIVGQPMTRSEALADVRARGWPDADILEN